MIIYGVIHDYMKKDHTALDRLLLDFCNETDTQKAKQLFSGFSSRLGRHMACEENVLFPLFEEKTGSSGLISSPTSVLRIAHRSINDTVGKISEALVNNEKTKDLTNKLNETIIRHEEIEINIVYPWLDEIIGPKTAAAIIDKFGNNSKEQVL